MRACSGALALLIVTTGCAAPRDDTRLLSIALQDIERRQPVKVIVLAPNLPEQPITAASKLRKVLKQSDLAPVPGYDLPAGHFLLKSIEFSDNTAHLIGTMGPVPSHATLDCGSHYDYSFIYKSGQWVSGEVEMTVC